MQKNIIVVTSGGFDPVHSGHVEYLQEASKLGKVIVALNSDEWLIRKKGKAFMSWSERKIILNEMKSVSEVIAFNDNDGSASDAIQKVRDFYKDSGSKIVFAKGGDRTLDNIPEVGICERLGVEMIFDVGKSGKIQSSSQLLQNRSQNK